MITFKRRIMFNGECDDLRYRVTSEIVARRFLSTRDSCPGRLACRHALSARTHAGHVSHRVYSCLVYGTSKECVCTRFEAHERKCVRVRSPMILFFRANAHECSRNPSVRLMVAIRLYQQIKQNVFQYLYYVLY